MSKGWKRSDLKIGEEVILPNSLFITGSQAINRLISATYVGEVDTGIIIDCLFRSGVSNTISRISHYKMMINWASIYCGHIRLYKEDSSQIRARRISKEVIND